MNTYAADAAELVEKLNLRDAIHIGHSTGGGEVARYVAKYGKGRVAKAVLISAVPPIMVKSDRNPGGTPIEVFDKISRGHSEESSPVLRGHHPSVLRLQPTREPLFLREFGTTGGVRGMMGGIKAHYDCIRSFSETDFTEDLKKIDVPTFVMHGEDDQIVPFADAGPLSAKLLKSTETKFYPGFPHGMPTTNAEQINTDLLGFIKA
jgi:non-heme chloroperoxidase